MKRILILTLCVSLVMSYTSITFGAASVELSENFESATSLDSWNNSSTTPWTVSRKTMDNNLGVSTNVLSAAMKSGQSSPSPTLKKSFTPITDKTEVSMWIYPEAASTSSAAYVFLDPGIFTLTLRQSNYSIDLPDGSSAGNFKVGTWFNVKFVIDPNSGIDIWIDGVLKRSAIPFPSSYVNAGLTGLSGVTIGSYYKFSNTFCYDDIIISKPNEINYYVSPIGNDSNLGAIDSPFKTIEKARDVVRTINSNMTENINVYLRGGTYNLSSAIDFDERDSGTNGYNIVYRNYLNETPELSGGQSITGWKLYNAEKNIYRATLPNHLETRQLYVNGVRATRARSVGGLTNVVHPPHTTFIGSDGLSHYVPHTDTGFTTTDTFIADYKNISDMEMIFKKDAGWTTPRCKVDSVAVLDNIATVTMMQPGWSRIDNKGYTSATEPWYYENAYELLDSEGEWYLDRTGDIGGSSKNAYSVYYKPRAGEDMTNALTVAGSLEKLVNVNGTTLDTPVHNMMFRGITFKETTWNRPSGADGHNDAQNNVVLDSNGFIIDAALNLKFAKSVIIERCTFVNLGAIGIDMYAGCQDNLVQGCKFDDIAGNGLQVGEYTSYDSLTSENYVKTTDARLILRNNDVINNYFNNCGVEYYSANAIAAIFPQDMNISHNEISNMPYGGIHIGWHWTSIDSSIGKNNYIEYNYIHDVIQKLDDCAAIYTIGSQGSTTEFSYINKNYINISNDHALYFDNGSGFWKADSNVFDNIKNVNINLSSPDKHDITVTNWYADDSAYWNKGTNCSVSSGILKTNGVWSAAAQTIINGAGIQASYADIKASSINPQVISYDKNPVKSANIPINMTLNSDTLKLISNSSSTLVNGTDYIITGNVCTILSSYLSTKSVGDLNLTFDFNTRMDQFLDINIIDTTTPAVKTVLSQTIDLAQGKVASDYTNATWVILQNALSKAGVVMANVTATQGDVDSEVSAISKAIVGLEFNQKVLNVNSDTSSGDIIFGKKLTLSSNTIGAKIYFTTDGTEPTTQATSYEAPISVGNDCDLRFIAVKYGMRLSDISNYNYHMVGSNLFNEGFDSPPFTKWTTMPKTADYWVEQSILPDTPYGALGQEYGIKIVTGQAANPASLNWSSTAISPLIQGNVFVDYWAYPIITGSSNTGTVYVNSQSSNFAMTFRRSNFSDLTLECNGSAVIDANGKTMNFYNNNWYHIKLKISSTGSVDVYVNDELVKSGANFSGAYAGIKSFTIAQYKWNTTFYYDRINVTYQLAHQFSDGKYVANNISITSPNTNTIMASLDIANISSSSYLTGTLLLAIYDKVTKNLVKVAPFKSSQVVRNLNESLSTTITDISSYNNNNYEARIFLLENMTTFKPILPVTISALKKTLGI